MSEKTKTVYQVEVTDEDIENEPIERNKKEKRVKPEEKIKRPLNEKQREALALGHQKLKEKRAEKELLKKELEEKSNALMEKQITKKVKKEMKEKTLNKKLELLKQELENNSSSSEEEEIILKKVKHKKESKQIRQPMPQYQEPVKVSLRELMKMKGF